MPLPETPDPLVDITSALSDDQPHKKLSESIDVVGGAGTTPNVSFILPHLKTSDWGSNPTVAMWCPSAKTKTSFA